jgi:hypothetical protein
MLKVFCAHLKSLSCGYQRALLSKLVPHAITSAHIEDSRDSVLNADCDGVAIASGARQRIITQS